MGLITLQATDAVWQLRLLTAAMLCATPCQVPVCKLRRLLCSVACHAPICCQSSHQSCDYSPDCMSTFKWMAALRAGWASGTWASSSTPGWSWSWWSASSGGARSGGTLRSRCLGLEGLGFRAACTMLRSAAASRHRNPFHTDFRKRTGSLASVCGCAGLDGV